MVDLDFDFDNQDMLNTAGGEDDTEFQSTYQGYLDELTGVGHDPNDAKTIAQRLATKVTQGKPLSNQDEDVLMGILSAADYDPDK